MSCERGLCYQDWTTGFRGPCRSGSYGALSHLASFSHLPSSPVVFLLFPLAITLRFSFPPYMAGYFAFPPPAPSIAPPAFRQTLADKTLNVSTPNVSPKHPQERTRDAQKELESEVQAQTQRHELEREQVRLGEMEWIRSGGWLRDAFGRKDKARTERLREEVRLFDAERKALEQWDAYQARWRVLLTSAALVTFTDIPWPVSPSATSVDDLTSDAITDFFLAPLRVRANTVSRKERVRSSILRWHPDKMSGVVARTVEEDLASVRTGINSVFHILRSLQDATTSR